jgi:hypothetical protein
MKNIRKIHATATEWYVFVPTGECVRAFSKARAIESLQAFNPTFQVGESNVLLESEYNQRLAAGQLEIE